jgi:hypothetical protein
MATHFVPFSYTSCTLHLALRSTSSLLKCSSQELRTEQVSIWTIEKASSDCRRFVGCGMGKWRNGLAAIIRALLKIGSACLVTGRPARRTARRLRSLRVVRLLGPDVAPSGSCGCTAASLVRSGHRRIWGPATMLLERRMIGGHACGLQARWRWALVIKEDFILQHLHKFAGRLESQLPVRCRYIKSLISER